MPSPFLPGSFGRFWVDISLTAGSSWVTSTDAGSGHHAGGGRLPRPNDVAIIGTRSTLTSVPNIRGGVAQILPQNKSQEQPIEFTWKWRGSRLRDVVHGLVNSGTYCRLVMGNDRGNPYPVLIGHFINATSTIMPGQSDTGNWDTFNIQATFLTISGIG